MQRGSGGPYNSPVRAAPQRDCVGRHLANTNKMRVSGSDSYALLFMLLHSAIGLFLCIALYYCNRWPDLMGFMPSLVVLHIVNA